MKNKDAAFGAAVVAAALLMIFAGVPGGVVSPKTVDHRVLSPLFWPTVLSWALLLAGAALVLRAAAGRPKSSPAPADGISRAAPVRAGVVRLAAFVALLAGYASAIPWAGMPWASVVVIAAMVAGARCRHWKAGVAVAVLLPPALWGFFTHVAGVPIPVVDFSKFP